MIKNYNKINKLLKKKLKNLSKNLKIMKKI